MKWYRRTTAVALMAMGLAVLAACDNSMNSSEDYQYQALTAELVDVPTGSDGTISHAITDDGNRLTFDTAGKVGWMQKSDTTYRALLYYNKVATSMVTPLKVQEVLVLRPKTAEEAGESAEQRDPLEITSLWRGRNGKYANINIRVKSGAAIDGTIGTQRVGLVKDSIHTSPTGKRVYYHISHSQNGVPAYYSVDTYCSIPLNDISVNDTISLNVTTWSGHRTLDL